MRTQFKCVVLATITMTATVAGDRVDAQSQLLKTAVCEVRPECFVIKQYGPSGFNEPFCETILGDVQYLGGTCQNGLLTGTVKQVMWFGKRADLVSFQLYRDGLLAQSSSGFFVRHQAGRMLIERIGVGTVHDCGAIGHFDPSEESAQPCRETQAEYGAETFAQQPPLIRGRFRVRTASASVIPSPREDAPPSGIWGGSKVIPPAAP